MKMQTAQSQNGQCSTQHCYKVNLRFPYSHSGINVSETTRFTCVLILNSGFYETHTQRRINLYLTLLHRIFNSNVETQNDNEHSSRSESQ